VDTSDPARPADLVNQAVSGEGAGRDRIVARREEAPQGSAAG
jgi:hypothetical protein